MLSEPVTNAGLSAIKEDIRKDKGVFTGFYRLFNMKIEVIFSASLSPAQNELSLFRVSGRHGNGLAGCFARG